MHASSENFVVAKKIKIDIDFNQDNFLMAISCHKRDYWLAYQINENLKVEFKKIDDLGFYHNNLDQILPYPIYYYQDPISGLSWYLIGNHHPDGKLFPTLKNADFFILLNGVPLMPEPNQVIAELKKINGILHVYAMDTQKLKEFGNFLSDLELHMIDFQKK